MKTSAQINMIVAVTPDLAIGRGGQLLYRLSPDMRHFKTLTSGHTVIMGRKTWESLPNGALPQRRNIIVSRNAEYKAEGAEVYTDIAAALRSVNAGEKVFIIGGEQIYSLAMPLADTLYLTFIDAPSEGADTFFPDIDTNMWREAATDDSAWHTDEKTGLKYRFVCLSRKK